LFIAFELGFFPNPEKQVLHYRTDLARALGMQAAAAVNADAPHQFADAVRPLLAEGKDLVSAGLRDSHGNLLADINDHASKWQDPGNRSTPSQMWLRVYRNDMPWGRAEFTFRPFEATSWWGIFPRGEVGRLFALIGCLSLLAYAGYLWFFVRKTFAQISQIIPHRVRQALDMLVEGVLILDKSQRVAHANSAFLKMASAKGQSIIGTSVDELGLSLPPGVAFVQPGMPWDWAIETGETVLQVPLVFRPDHYREFALSVNAAPVTAEDGTCCGVLATFDAMTDMEQKNSALEELLLKLKNSRAEIHRQNKELKLLADRDPLTMCLNRRAFLTELNTLYEQAARTGAPLGCILVDVDRFKQINDKHGHTAGDQVLVKVAEFLRNTSRTTDLVCRYGGEEFVLVLPQTDLEGTVAIAERIRVALSATKMVGIDVTASFGVSALQLGPNGPQGLLDQADKALYAAKRGGRNQVVQFDAIPPETEFRGSDTPWLTSAARPLYDTAIPYPAVTALISALAYRDNLTAEHSRRVANLCIACAKDILSQRDVYLLEVAALLHDIGKLGVPDAILFKPSALTEEEWKVMRLHDRMGVEIISAAFASEQLTRIVATHLAWFGGTPHDPSLPTGVAIPLPARILAIADAYDSMTTDRVYRKSRTQAEAFAELRRFAGPQFDPDMVERMIGVIQAATPAESNELALVSKDIALAIGTQIEKLAAAIDRRDAVALGQMAQELSKTARTCGITSIIEVATRLEQAARCPVHNWVELVNMSCELLELCRSTQSTYLREARHTSAQLSAPSTPVARTERRRKTDVLSALNTLDSDSGRELPTVGVLPPVSDVIDEGPATERIALRQGREN
jgi:diguanylate cyclase (GGDEF)-like protein/putative nucleotidyltransferase with HDIG domain